MTEQEIERDMYARAVALIEERYPTGWGGAAVLRAEDGRCFTSVALENANSSVLLCIEVGAMCEAHKYNVKATHCLCVVRDDEHGLMVAGLRLVHEQVDPRVDPEIAAVAVGEDVLDGGAALGRAGAVRSLGSFQRLHPGALSPGPGLG